MTACGRSPGEVGGKIGGRDREQEVRRRRFRRTEKDAWSIIDVLRGKGNPSIHDGRTKPQGRRFSSPHPKLRKRAGGRKEGIANLAPNEGRRLIPPWRISGKGRGGRSVSASATLGEMTYREKGRICPQRAPAPNGQPSRDRERKSERAQEKKNRSTYSRSSTGAGDRPPSDD